MLSILAANRLATPDERAAAWAVLMSSVKRTDADAIQEGADFLCAAVTYRLAQDRAESPPC